MEIDVATLRTAFDIFLNHLNRRRFNQACQLYSINAVRSSGSRCHIGRDVIADFFEKIKPFLISHYHVGMEPCTDEGKRVQVVLEIMTAQKNPSDEIELYKEFRMLQISLDDHDELHIDSDQPYAPK